MSELEDKVNNPSHYTAGGVECIDAIQAALGDDGFKEWLKGNAIKYLWRANHKGCEKQDYQKAQFFINRLNEFMEDDEAANIKGGAPDVPGGWALVTDEDIPKGTWCWNASIDRWILSTRRFPNRGCTAIVPIPLRQNDTIPASWRKLCGGEIVAAGDYVCNRWGAYHAKASIGDVADHLDDWYRPRDPNDC